MTPHLNLPAPSTRRPAYFVYLTSRGPVFLINSHMGRFSAASTASGCSPSTVEAPLVPKLRGNFAEFLHESSHERLRIRSLPACVGFWYGRPTNSQRSFSRGRFRSLRQHKWARVASMDIAVDLPAATTRAPSGISDRP